MQAGTRRRLSAACRWQVYARTSSRRADKSPRSESAPAGAADARYLRALWRRISNRNSHSGRRGTRPVDLATPLQRAAIPSPASNLPDPVINLHPIDPISSADARATRAQIRLSITTSPRSSSNCICFCLLSTVSLLRPWRLERSVYVCASRPLRPLEPRADGIRIWAPRLHDLFCPTRLSDATSGACKRRCHRSSPGRRLQRHRGTPGSQIINGSRIDTLGLFDFKRRRLSTVDFAGCLQPAGDGGTTNYAPEVHLGSSQPQCSSILKLLAAWEQYNGGN